jgi:hypothetical protein
MQRKDMSTTREDAALATFVQSQIGVEHNDDLGPWLGLAAWVDEIDAARSSGERASGRGVVSALGDVPALARRPPRKAAKARAHKRSAR